jgi:Protein of unknown function (DUF4199)
MPDKKQSILLGGLVAGLLSTSYLGMINFLCCAGVIIGAVVAVWHYTDTNEITLKVGQGAVLGLLAALVGWAVSFILNYILIKSGIRSDLMISQMILDRFGDSMPPDAYDQMMDAMNAELTFGKYVLSAIWGVVASLIFGSIGGMIGAVIFKKGGDEPTEFDD